MNRVINSNVSALSGSILGLVLAGILCVSFVMPQGVVNAADLGGDEGYTWGDPMEGPYGSDSVSGGGEEIYSGESGGWYNEGESMGGLCDYDCYGGDIDYGYDDYGYGGGSYSMGGGSYTPSYSTGGGSYSTGGGYYMAPRSYSPPQTSSTSGGSQTQSQTQSTTVSNTNTNTNINNNTAIAVVQIPGNYATPSYPNYPTTPTYPAPYCSIYQAQSYTTGYGARPVYISWSSSNAQSAYLSNYGSVAVNGSQTVYPTYTTTYTLTVYGYNGQQATCQTTVQMNSYVPPVTPITPYVSLTQIPYTGFDFGTFGNAMYWAGLAILALGGAYLAVYFIPQVALASFSNRKFAPVVAAKAPLLLEREAAEAKFSNIVAALNKKGTNDTMAIVHEKGSMPKIVVDRS